MTALPTADDIFHGSSNQQPSAGGGGAPGVGGYSKALDQLERFKNVDDENDENAEFDLVEDEGEGDYDDDDEYGDDGGGGGGGGDEARYWAPVEEVYIDDRFLFGYGAQAQRYHFVYEVVVATCPI